MKVNHRFPLVEGFSTSCTSACNQDNIDPSIRTACDTGSQAYCILPTNVASKDCVTYLDRIVRTVNAEKTGIQYSNKVLPPSGTTVGSYNDALNATLTDYITSNVKNLQAPEIVNLISTIKTADPTSPMLSSMTKTAIDKCSATTGCDTNVSWIKTEVAAMDKDMASRAPTSTLSQIFTDLSSKTAYWTYGDLFTNLNNVIISKLSIASLTTDGLMKFRDSVSAIRQSIDLIVVSYILDKLITAIPLNASGEYDIDISNQTKLYDQTIRKYYALLLKSSRAQTDNLTKLITKTDAINKERCKKVNPTVDPVCVSMRLTAEPDLVTAIDAALPSYCLNGPNVLDPNCISYFNKIIVTDPTFDRTNVYKSVLGAALLAKDNKYDTAIVGKYDGIQTWIKSQTADKVTTDINGQTIVTPICGTTGGLSVDDCKRVCATYPEQCAGDQVQKCKLPQYRYATEGFCDNDSDDQDSLGMWLAIILTIIAIAIACNYLLPCIKGWQVSQSRMPQYEDNTKSFNSL